MNKNVPFSFLAHVFGRYVHFTSTHTNTRTKKIAIVDNWIHIIVNVRRTNERNFDGHFY
jgi:hypothetical protein